MNDHDPDDRCCRRCGDTYDLVEPFMDPTPYCDRCAHLELEDRDTLIAQCVEVLKYFGTTDVDSSKAYLEAKALLQTLKEKGYQ